MSGPIRPKPGDILEERSTRTDFMARYIVLSVGESVTMAAGISYQLYILYVESPSLADRNLQGTIDVVYNLELNNVIGEWSIIS
jgi:hypothetical protein